MVAFVCASCFIGPSHLGFSFFLLDCLLSALDFLFCNGCCYLCAFSLLYLPLSSSLSSLFVSLVVLMHNKQVRSRGTSSNPARNIFRETSFVGSMQPCILDRLHWA